LAEPAHVSKSYADPTVLPFDPPMAFDQEDPAERTLKFCAVFDNGRDHPSLLKRKSQLPMGAPCYGALYCAGGRARGAACQSDADCEGGSCDACAVTWGVTTEDEMFFLMGNYYVAPP
jgi:hypothetical protein